MVPLLVCKCVCVCVCVWSARIQHWDWFPCAYFPRSLVCGVGGWGGRVTREYDV